MKKRWLMFCLALTMVCVVTGCDTEGATDTQKARVEQEEDDEKDGTDTKAEPDAETGKDDVTEITDAGTADTLKEVPHMKITKEYYDPGEENDAYFSGFYETAEITDDVFPELKEAVATWSQDMMDSYQSVAEQYISDAQAEQEYLEENGTSYSFTRTLKAARLDSRIVSVAILESSYNGGVHGNTYLYGTTFDTRTGEEIFFEDLGDIREDMLAYVDTYIAEQRENGYVFSFYDDVKTAEDFLANPSWYLNGLGLNIVFNEYEIGSYAEGRTVVTIPYEKLNNFNGDYIPSGNAMFADLYENVTAMVDVDGDGVLDEVTLQTEYDENGDKNMRAIVNTEELELGSCAWIENIYFLRNENGESFLMVTCDQMSDDYVTTLLDLSDGTPKQIDEIGCQIESIGNDGITARGAIYVLGTYNGRRDYTISKEGFSTEQERFVFENGADVPYPRGVVLAEALTVQVQTENEWTERELAAGTMLYPVNSDGESVVGFELEDGTYGEISFERQDGTIYINGISEYDLFEELPYVG